MCVCVCVCCARVTCTYSGSQSLLYKQGSHRLQLAAGLPCQNYVYITTNESFRFHNNQLDEMLCQLHSTYPAYASGRMFFRCYATTQVALQGWVLRKEIFRPNLQARFCKFYFADFLVVIYLFVCS